MTGTNQLINSPLIITRHITWFGGHPHIEIVTTNVINLTYVYIYISHSCSFSKYPDFIFKPGVYQKNINCEWKKFRDKKENINIHREYRQKMNI